MVVGASVGGLAAAIMAADRGSRVVLVERSKELGGGATLEPEFIAAAGTRFQRTAGVTDDPECFATDILARTRHHVPEPLAHAVAAESAAVLEWLAERCGMLIELIPQTWEGHSVARLHVTGERGGSSLVTDLARAAGHHARISVRTEHAAYRLEPDQPHPRLHVRPERRGSEQIFSCPVLLASGGFAGNEELVRQHCPAVAEMPYLGWSGAVGDSLRLGAELGAATARLGSFVVTPVLATPGQLAVTAPLVSLGAILVNQAGRRFVDETGEALQVAIRVRSQPGHMAYVLFDETIAAAARSCDPFFARVVLPRHGRHGPTIAALAKQFEINEEGLALTLDTYNSNLELGGDPFGREAGAQPLTPPYHAIRVAGARIRTLGGLDVDARARVLDAHGAPIPGLFATGGAAAGLGGEGTEGSIAGVDTLAALGYARLAVETLLAARGGA